MTARGRQTSRSRTSIATSQPWAPRREWTGSEARLITLNPHSQWHTSSRMAPTLKDSTMSPNEATSWGLSVRISSLWGGHSDHHTQYNKKQNKAEPKPWQLQYEEATETTLWGLCSRGEFAWFQRLQHNLQNGDEVDVSSGQAFFFFFFWSLMTVGEPGIPHRFWDIKFAWRSLNSFHSRTFRRLESLIKSVKMLAETALNNCKVIFPSRDLRKQVLKF